jgi:hypothetical protein
MQEILLFKLRMIRWAQQVEKCMQGSDREANRDHCGDLRLRWGDNTEMEHGAVWT